MPSSRAYLAPVVASTLLVALVGFAGSAMASGFGAARFGGEHGTPADLNPTALYYNPGALGMINGTRVFMDLSLAYRTLSFERDAGAVSPSTLDVSGTDGNIGEGTAANLIASPMFGVTSDLFMDSPLKFGLAFSAPFGGQATWDEVSAPAEYKGATDGPNRWYAIDGSIRTLALTGGMGYLIEPARLSIGLTGNLYMTEIHTLRARNGDGTDALLTSSGALAEGRSELDTTSTDWGIGAGVLWEAMPRQLWIGASYQSAPNLDGKITTEGTLRNLLGTGVEETSDVEFTHALPDIARLGVRFKPQPNVEVRVFGDYTRWSVLDQQCLYASNLNDPDKACETNADGSKVSTDESVIQIFQRRYEDAFGVRLSGSYWFSKEVEGIAGLGYDGNAVPDQTIDPALLDMDKLTFSLGGGFDLTESMTLMVTATEVFYLERDTSGKESNDAFELPSKQPGAQGVYSQNILLLNTNLEFKF